jgi:hypothetical protein
VRGMPAILQKQVLPRLGCMLPTYVFPTTELHVPAHPTPTKERMCLQERLARGLAPSHIRRAAANLAISPVYTTII